MAGRPPAGYVFQPFPKCKYHPDGRVVVVQDAGEEQLLGPVWADRPPSSASVPVAVPPKRRGRPPKEIRP